MRLGSRVEPFSSRDLMAQWPGPVPTGMDCGILPHERATLVPQSKNEKRSRGLEELQPLLVRCHSSQPCGACLPLNPPFLPALNGGCRLSLFVIVAAHPLLAAGSKLFLVLQLHFHSSFWAGTEAFLHFVFFAQPCAHLAAPCPFTRFVPFCSSAPFCKCLRTLCLLFSHCFRALGALPAALACTLLFGLPASPCHLRLALGTG